MSVKYDFSGKKVLVTGGNRGLGLGVAKAFAAANADLTILGLEDDVESVAQDLTSTYEHPVSAIRCDIADLADVRKAAAEIEALDILINNAGLEYITPLSDPSPDVDAMFRRITEINVIGTFSVTRALLPKIADGGRVVMTASIWAKTAVAEYSAYCASKHAVLGLTRSFAHELAPRDIAVNAVCPGWVKTEASLRSLKHMAERSGRSEEDLLAEITGAQAFGGLMEPDDLAPTFLYLASDAAKNITGQAYTVDRGEIMQ
ncbi:MAG: SDR family oxidoreductase [Pseudomonadota bacterium]